MGLNHSPKISTDGLKLCLDAANPRSYPGTGANFTDLKQAKLLPPSLIAQLLVQLMVGKFNLTEPMTTLI